MRRIVAVAIVIVFTGFGAKTWAQPVKQPIARPAGPRPSSRRAPGAPAKFTLARKLFKEGIRLFDRGHYNQAKAKFTEALKHYRSPKIHTRIALCYKWLGNKLKTLEHYETFLRLYPKKPKKRSNRLLRRRVEIAVDDLRKLVSQLRIKIDRPVGAEVRVNGKLIARAPLDRTLRLNPGPAAVTVIAKGYHVFRRDLRLAPRQRAPVVITLLKIKPKVIKQVIRLRAVPIYKRWWFWTAIGVVLAGGATGLGVGLSPRGAQRDLTGTPVFHDNLGRR